MRVSKLALYNMEYDTTNSLRLYITLMYHYTGLCCVPFIYRAY